MHLLDRIASPGRIAFAAAVASLALWAALVWPLAPVLDTLEEMSGDWAWRLVAERERERRLILVDIDEASVARLGPWPWPRERLAELSERLAAEGAALQVFDIVLPASNAADALLGERLVTNHAILSQVFALEPGTQAADGKPGGALNWPKCPAFVAQSKGYIANAPALSAVPTGHITPIIGSDGIVRRQPAVICHEGRVYPALFLAALAMAQGGGEPELVAGAGPLDASWALAELPVGGDGLIPLGADGSVRIPWAFEPSAFISLSAADVLERRVPSGLLNNTLVLVGSTALGVSDRVATPFGGSSAGLMVHAQLILGALDGRLPLAPLAGDLIAFVAAAVSAAILIGLARRRCRLWCSVIAAPILVLLLLGIKMGLLVRGGIWLEWARVALFVVLFALFLGLFEYARSRFERQRVYNHLASYLPGPVAAMLAGRDPSGAIEAERANVTALYADIRNFSAYCETRPPEEAAAVLHAFFGMVNYVVEKHGGVVESFYGDGVLVIWGARALGAADGGPAPEAALAAASDILRESRRILPGPADGDVAPLALGVGMESGLATVGSVGSARRRAHLAMGHPITAAVRLQEMTAELAHPILIGQDLTARLRAHRLEPLGAFLLEGLTTPCDISAVPLQDCV